MKRNKLKRKFRRNLIVSLMTLSMIQGMSLQAVEGGPPPLPPGGPPPPPPGVPLPPGVPPPPGVPLPPGVPPPPGAPKPVGAPAKKVSYDGPKGKAQKALELFYSTAEDEDVKGSLQEQVKTTLNYISSEWAPSYIKDYVDFGDQGEIGGNTKIKISKEYVNKHLEELTTIVEAPEGLADDDKKKILKNYWKERDYICGQMATRHQVIVSQLPEVIDPGKTEEENKGRISPEKHAQYSRFNRPWAQPAKMQVYFFKIKINEDQTCEAVGGTSIDIPSAVFSVFPRSCITNETSGNKSCSGMKFYYDESEKEVLKKQLQEFQMSVIDEYDANKICDKSVNGNPFKMNDQKNRINAPALDAEKIVGKGKGKGKKQPKANADKERDLKKAEERDKKEFKEIIDGANNSIQEEFKKLADKDNDVERYKIIENQVNVFNRKIEKKFIGTPAHISKMKSLFNDAFKKYANIKNPEINVDYKDVWFSTNGKLSCGDKTDKNDKEFYKGYAEYQKKQKNQKEINAELAKINELNNAQSHKRRLRAEDLYETVEKPKEVVEAAKKKAEKYPKKEPKKEQPLKPFELPKLKKQKYEDAEKVAKAKAKESPFMKELAELRKKSKGFEYKEKEKEKDNGEAFFANLKNNMKQKKLADPAVADPAELDPATQKTQNPNFGNFGETGCGYLKEQLKNLCQKSNNPEGMSNILNAIKSSTEEATKSLKDYLNKNLGSLDDPKILANNVDLVYKAQPHNYAFDYCDITNDRDKRKNAATTNIPHPAASAKAEFRKTISIDSTKVDIGDGDELVCKPAHFVTGTLTVPVEYCQVDENSKVAKETLTFKVPFAVVKAQDDNYNIVYGFNDKNIGHLNGLAEKVRQLQEEDVQRRLLNDPQNQIRPRLETIPDTTSNLLVDVYTPMIKKLEPNLKTYKKKLEAIQKQAANGKNPANPNPVPAAKPNAKTAAEIQDEQFFNKMLPIIKDNVLKRIQIYEIKNQEFLKNKDSLKKYNYYKGLVDTIRWCRHSVVSNLLYSHQNEQNTEGTPEHALRPNKAAFNYFGIKENEKIDKDNFHVDEEGLICYNTDKMRKYWDDSIFRKQEEALATLARLRKYETKNEFAAGNGKKNNGIETFENHIKPIMDKEKERLAQLEKEKEEREKKEKEEREKKEKEEKERIEKEEKEKKEKEEKEKKEKEEKAKIEEENKKKAEGKLADKKVKGADAKRKEEVKKETVIVKQLKELNADEQHVWEFYGDQTEDDTLRDASELFPNIKKLFEKEGPGEIKPEDEKDREERLKKKKEELAKKKEELAKTVEKLKLETDKNAEKFVENKFNPTVKKEEPKAKEPKKEEAEKEEVKKEEVKEEEVKKEETKEEITESDKAYDDLAKAWSATDSELMDTQRELAQTLQQLDEANKNIAKQDETIANLNNENTALKEANEKLQKEAENSKTLAEVASGSTIATVGTGTLALGTEAGRKIVEKVAPKLTRDIAARFAAQAVQQTTEEAAKSALEDALLENGAQALVK